MQWPLDNMKNFSVTDWAAWWGALIATTVLIWDVIKWIKRGPKIKLDMQVSGNMKMYPPDPDDKTYVSARVCNNGSGAVTLTNLGYEYYSCCLRYILHLKPTKSFVILRPIAAPIPHTLNVGQIWDAYFLQTDKIVEMANNGVAVVALYHSGSKKPIKRKLKIK